MPHKVVWNKKHTKIKIWSTIVDGYITNFEKPEDLLETVHRNTVLSQVYNKNPFEIEELNAEMLAKARADERTKILEKSAQLYHDGFCTEKEHLWLKTVVEIGVNK